MKTDPRPLLLWLIIGASTSGCAEAPPESAESPDPRPPAIAPAEDRSAQVSLEVIDAAAWGAVLQRHRGKVVLVDFWATWCGPCVKMFPHTVELHRRFADEGLVVISVSLDDPDEEAAVRDFLVRHRATFENYLSAYGVGSETFEAFEIDAVPHFKIYDRDGVLAEEFVGGSGPIDLGQLDRAVEGMLSP